MEDLRFPQHPADHPLNSLPDTVFVGNKFVAKLNRDERCAILALRISGVSVPQLAATFDVNRRTINKIVDSGSSKYHDVREELARLGNADFIATYVTEAIAARVRESVVKPEVGEKRFKEYDESASSRANHPNKRASTNSGINNVKLPHHDYSHRIEVAWLEANTAEDDNGPFEHPAGWYWRDMDSDTPERWQGDPEAESHLTSSRALNHAKAHC
jgi:hypothetical protein